MRGERALFLQEGQRWIGAVPSHLWDGEAGKEEEKGLQDKGRPSCGLLSVCLHISFSRDRAWPEGDRLAENVDNLPFSGAKCEQHFGSALGIELRGVRDAPTAWLS